MIEWIKLILLRLLKYSLVITVLLFVLISSFLLAREFILLEVIFISFLVGIIVIMLPYIFVSILDKFYYKDTRFWGDDDNSE